LDRAEQLSGGQVFVVNWISGIVRAQLPNSFHQRKTAEEQLQWCVADRAEILVDYLGLSAKQLARALQHMVADGKYELAASLLESSGDRFAQSESVAKFKRLIYLKLMEQYQNTDPFKFILYSAKAGEQTPQMGAGG
jgi:hypothetical protein